MAVNETYSTGMPGAKVEFSTLAARDRKNDVLSFAFENQMENASGTIQAVPNVFEESNAALIAYSPAVIDFNPMFFQELSTNAQNKGMTDSEYYWKAIKAIYSNKLDTQYVDDPEILRQERVILFRTIKKLKKMSLQEGGYFYGR